MIVGKKCMNSVLKCTLKENLMNCNYETSP